MSEHLWYPLSAPRGIPKLTAPMVYFSDLPPTERDGNVPIQILWRGGFSWLGLWAGAKPWTDQEYRRVRPDKSGTSKVATGRKGGNHLQDKRGSRCWETILCHQEPVKAVCKKGSRTFVNIPCTGLPRRCSGQYKLQPWKHFKEPCEQIIKEFRNIIIYYSLICYSC